MRHLNLIRRDMSDNLDEFLNSLGFSSEGTESRDITVVAGSQQADILQSMVNDAVVNEDLSSAEPASANSLTESDFDSILQENGFSEPLFQEAEEVHNDSDDETDWNEERGEGEGGVTNPSTEELRNALESSPHLQESFDRFREATSETRDLDAEEDAEWEERIASGELVEANTSEEPLLPLNSPTLLMDEATSRFSGTEWFNEIQKARIVVAGIGGIGSNTVFQLARMNPAALFMFDDDTVEMANMSGQLYSRNDVGKTKVGAMYDMVRAYTNIQNVYAIPEKYTPSSEASDIMICGFDNMEARKVFFGVWCNHLINKTPEEKKKCLYLDGRLSIDTLQVFALTGDDNQNILRYQNEYLFSDAEADETVCSIKQTTYLACMIGSVITNLFTNFIANSLDPIIPYDLPFFTEYDAQNMIFKTIK